MKNLTGKDLSKFYEMDDEQIRNTVKTANGYTFKEEGHNSWSVKYYKKKHGYGKSGSTGHIYVLQNTSMPGIFKVGFTERSVAERINEINSATGVITPWQVRDFWFCDEPYNKEQEIHRRLDDYRVESNREGFFVNFMYIRKVIFEVLGIEDPEMD